MIRNRRFRPITVELDGKKYSVFNDGSMYLQKEKDKTKHGLNFNKLSRVCRLDGGPTKESKAHTVRCMMLQNRTTLTGVSLETKQQIIQRGVVIDG